MPEPALIDETICQQLLVLKLSPQAMEQELRSKGFNDDAIVEYLKAVRRKRIAKRQFTGFICMAGGAFLGFLSCVLTITHAFPQFYGFVFYGLTILAVCIVVAGLYFVFE